MASKPFIMACISLSQLCLNAEAQRVCLGSALYCESVGAEFCLSKQLAAGHDGRLSSRDLFHPEI